MVTTGDKEDMATLNRVLLYVYGTNNVAGPMVLGSGNSGHFKAGATDEFKVNRFHFLYNCLIQIRLGPSFIVCIGHVCSVIKQLGLI